MSETTSNAAPAPAGKLEFVAEAPAQLSVDDWASFVPDDDAPEGEATAPEPAGDEPEVDVTADEEPEAEPEAEDEQDDGPGSKSNPYTVKTLPKDQYVKVKVDGQETTVPLAELADGYIREETFHKRMGRTDVALKTAREIAEAALSEREGLRTNFRATLNNPDQMYELLINNNEATLKALAIKYAGFMKHCKENPGSRERWEMERERARFQRERQSVEKEREERTRTEQEQRTVNEMRERLKPGYLAGLKAAGFPKPTPELQEMTNILLERVRRGREGPLEPDDVRDAIIKAAKVIRAQTVQERRPTPAPAPATPAKARTPDSRRKTLSKDDPEYWFQGVDQRGLRSRGR